MSRGPPRTPRRHAPNTERSSRRFHVDAARWRWCWRAPVASWPPSAAPSICTSFFERVCVRVCLAVSRCGRDGPMFNAAAPWLRLLCSPCLRDALPGRAISVQVSHQRAQDSTGVRGAGRAASQRVDAGWLLRHLSCVRVCSRPRLHMRGGTTCLCNYIRVRALGARCARPSALARL